MSRTFRYIQNDDVLKSFKEFKDTILSERPVVIARHGDYSLFMSSLSDDTLGLTIQNTEKKSIVYSRTYDINDTTDALVSRGVRHACQMMSELSDEEVNTRRLQIWKWYVLDWQKERAGKEDFVSKEISWDESKAHGNKDIMDIETFLHGEYLNLGNTLDLIERYLQDGHHKEVFKKFAIADIMEMTREDTKDKSLAEAEMANMEDGVKKHTYQFTVSVEATDKEHARQALASYLAGDERIRIQR